ncbi:MAG: sigma-70 family RNA polymerase sigma factor [Bacteroidales bacterium]|nr:sigma-70 family RNA polymerase sigma factor [Bacteroidales bacterium]HOY38218.1 sigma-70 family RNA polymerase sigma factor [Bacteroidales bacterium]HQP03021.1 sigma-70 family RNA polymerase sigma factor [Bacteroidales bacterium]
MRNEKENILLEGCRNLEPRAQKRLYDAYKNCMFTICMRITGNYEEARDALQDGFISVFNDISKFRGESSLGAWIKTIIIRAALKRLKPVSFIASDEIPDAPVEWDSEFTGEELQKAIWALPEGYRVVFIMFEVEGYSHTEIADILHISEGTSKSQLHYAKKKLKELLKSYR